MASASCSVSVGPTENCDLIEACISRSFPTNKSSSYCSSASCGGEQLRQRIEPVANCRHGRGGVAGLQLGQRLRLDQVEHDERPVLLVHHGPLAVGGVGAGEIHEPQRVFGVGRRPGVLLQRQPANAAVIVLVELPVDLDAPLLGEFELLSFLERRGDKEVVKGGKAMGPLAVGPARRLELQQAHVDPHLQQLAPVGAGDAPHHGAAGNKRPLAEQAVDVEIAGKIGHETAARALKCAIWG